MMRRTFIYLIPLLVFLALAWLFFVSLGKDQSVIPSPLINKSAPVFILPSINADQEVNPIEEYAGSSWILNVWASWCVSCREEHPIFIQARENNPSLILVGLNYQDASSDARDWLGELGDPYTISLSDFDGRVGIDWGVYGVPETFIIDAQGEIRYKHIGVVTKELMLDTLLPIIKKLNTNAVSVNKQ